MSGSTYTPTILEEFTPWHSENLVHRSTLRDGALDQKMKSNDKHLKIAELRPIIQGSRQPLVHLLVTGGKLVVAQITLHIRSIWKEEPNYLTAIVGKVLLLVGFRAQENSKICLPQGVACIILNRIVERTLQSAVACSNKFVHNVIQEVSPMR